jgi:pyrophosphatase PpaX
MPLQGILFDLDGTLANTIPVCIRSFQATVEHFTGQIPTADKIYAMFGPTEEGMLADLVPGRLAETLPYYLQTYERFHAQVLELFPGIAGALTRLKSKGIHMGIVTGKGQHSAAISLRLLGLGRWIDAVETGFPDKSDKPLCIRKILSRWQIQPTEAAYVGDAASDMDAARQVGLLPLGAAWAETSELRRRPDSQAATTFQDIDSFLDWVNQL